MTLEPTRNSDEELARQAQAGCSSAFEELVCRYQYRVHGFVAKFCRNPADAREVTQDTFVQAFQSLRGFDARRAFAPWLFTIARRKCIDRHRANPRQPEELGAEMADENDPGELLARREEGQFLWVKARQRLTENQFQALWLRYVEDLDIAQIAGVLGKTQVHVKVLLFRARQILGRELNSRFHPDRETPARRGDQDGIAGLGGTGIRATHSKWLA